MRNEIDKILAKGSLDSADVDSLVKLQSFLTQEEKVRLGFIPAPVLAQVEKEIVLEAPAPVKVKRAIKKKKI